MNEKINIFGFEIERYKLYGIYMTGRKPKQTQNITTNFHVSTLVEKIDYEYSCDFQWLTKSEKETILAFLKNNIGKKIKINRELFYEYEGGEYSILDSTMSISVIINLEDMQVTPKNNMYFDLKLKLITSDNYSISSRTHEFLEQFTHEQMSDKSHLQIEEGAI